MRERQHLAVDAGREERKVLRAHRTPRDLVRGCGRWVVKRRALVLSAAALGARDAAVPDGLLREWHLDPLKGRMRFDASAQLGLIRNCSDGGSVGHEPDRDAVRAEALDAPDLGLLDGGLQVSGDSPRDGTTQRRCHTHELSGLRAAALRDVNRVPLFDDSLPSEAVAQVGDDGSSWSMSPTAWALRTLIRRTAGAGASHPRSSLGISPTPRLVRHPRPVARAFGPSSRRSPWTRLRSAPPRRAHSTVA
jgi:hypothetical protein